jgi:protein tyrosine/serine phosphatase
MNRKMKIRERSKILFTALAVSLVVAVAVFGGQRGLPASEGILNFGRVNDTVCRGAQPDEAGIKRLRALGVKTIINLRQPKEDVKVEAMEAAASGINYTNVPLPGVERPKDADVRKILELMETSSGLVFVHCEHGCDRTGTIIACYRIHHDHWTLDEAMREAEKYGISKMERGMRRYIADFSKAEAARASTANSATAQSATRQ